MERNPAFPWLCSSAVAFWKCSTLSEGKDIYIDNTTCKLLHVEGNKARE